MCANGRVLQGGQLVMHEGRKTFEENQGIDAVMPSGNVCVCVCVCVCSLLTFIFKNKGT